MTPIRPDDPLSERSPFLLMLFGWYLRWYIHRRFHAVRVSRSGLPQVPPDKPLIIYSNHPSWWDPALFIVLRAALLPKRAAYGPMERSQLKRYGLLRRMGVFGIDPASARGAAEFLQISRRILADQQNILWVTAEGHFTDPRQRPVVLRPGIAHLIRSVPDVVFLPLAVEYSFWNESRPEALVRFGEQVTFGERRSAADTTAVLGAALTATMDVLARESMTRDTGLFLTLVHGVTGIGGIYDLWRRMRAWLGGRTFDAAHEPALDMAGKADDDSAGSGCRSVAARALEPDAVPSTRTGRRAPGSVGAHSSA